LRLGFLRLRLHLALGRRVGDDLLELRDLLFHRAVQRRSLSMIAERARLDRRQAAVDLALEDCVVDAGRTG